MTIDWRAKLQRFLQTIAFCLVIAALNVAFRPQSPLMPPVVYSLCIGICTWALIDFGSYLFPSAESNGWPTGLGGILLPLLGVTGGFVIGTSLADTWFGWSSWANTSSRGLMLSGLISAIIGIVITYYFYSKGKRAHLEEQVIDARLLAAQARLKLLETQLEPHMLFNTLSNLRVLIGIDPSRAQTMLDHMVAYLRSTLSASRASSHSVQDEFARLRDYLELMAVRMGPRLQFSLELPSHLAHHQVPTLLLQPLVENSIQHGLEPKISGGSLHVSARRDNDHLVLEVTDTGMGFDPTDPAFLAPPGKDSGFGVAQVRERLAVVYGPKATIQFIASPSTGTRATIRFPFQT